MTKKFHSADISLDPLTQFKIERTILQEDFINHTHMDFSELVVILSGSACHLIDGVPYKVSGGEVYVLNKTTEHEFQDVKDLAHYNIMYHPTNYLNKMDSIKQLPGYQALFVVEPLVRKQNHLTPMLQLNPSELDLFLHILQRIEHEFVEKKTGYDILLKAYFFEIIVFLARSYSYHSVDKNNISSLATVLSYIESHYTEDIDIETLSKIVNLSKRQFQRIFKCYFNQTPCEYIIQKRIQKACKLLRESSIDITNIAYSCGFNDANYFSRTFRFKMGVSPRSYRRC